MTERKQRRIKPDLPNQCVGVCDTLVDTYMYLNPPCREEKHVD